MPTFSSFFAKGKRKDQKDRFLTYNMSLFLKEENGKLALHYRFCESTYYDNATR